MKAPRLLWITPPRGPLAAMHAALDALTPALHEELTVLLRRLDVSARQLLSEARALGRHGLPVLVHRRLDVAMAAGAAGVHLPERGLGPAEVRRVWPEACVGVSRHDRAGLLAAAPHADYATLSPFGAVEGKGPPLDVDGFRSQRAGVPLPVLALGGVGPANAAAALAAGADGLAFIRAGFAPGALAAIAQALPRRP